MATLGGALGLGPHTMTPGPPDLAVLGVRYRRFRPSDAAAAARPELDLHAGGVCGRGSGWQSFLRKHIRKMPTSFR